MRGRLLKAMLAARTIAASQAAHLVKGLVVSKGAAC